jgi:hypothetical protein
VRRTTCDARGQVSREFDDPAQRGGLSGRGSELGRGGAPLVERGGTTARLLEERTLLEELWRISHFGWIPEAVIRRALTLAGGRELPTDSLHHGLRRLLDRGWVEHQASEDTDGEQRWRLSDRGRQIRES